MYKDSFNVDGVTPLMEIAQKINKSDHRILATVRYLNFIIGCLLFF